MRAETAARRRRWKPKRQRCRPTTSTGTAWRIRHTLSFYLDHTISCYCCWMCLCVCVFLWFSIGFFYFFFFATSSFEQFYLMGLSIGKRNVEKSCRGNENKSSFIRTHCYRNVGKYQRRRRDVQTKIPTHTHMHTHTHRPKTYRISTIIRTHKRAFSHPNGSRYIQYGTPF